MKVSKGVLGLVFYSFAPVIEVRGRSESTGLCVADGADDHLAVFLVVLVLHGKSDVLTGSTGQEFGQRSAGGQFLTVHFEQKVSDEEAAARTISGTVWVNRDHSSGGIETNSEVGGRFLPSGFIFPLVGKIIRIKAHVGGIQLSEKKSHDPAKGVLAGSAGCDCFILFANGVPVAVVESGVVETVPQSPPSYAVSQALVLRSVSFVGELEAISRHLSTVEEGR